MKLLESGEIKFHKTGRHRRIRFDDLMEYRRRLDEESRKASDELAAQARVVKITDGDYTVHVLDSANVRHKIRLAGIDALERGQAFGKRSKGTNPIW